MNLKQLEYFMAVVETKNITQAAKRLFVSQPPMSRQLTALEAEIGVRLFTRTNRGVELTDAGKLLYARSQTILSYIKDTQEAVQEAETGVWGRIKVGTVYTAIPCFARGVKQFRQQYPKVEFYVEPSLPNELLIKLEKGVIDVAFLRSPMSEVGNFPYMILENEPLVLAIHRDLDPCPEQDVIDVELLRDVPFCAQARAANWDYRNWDYNAMLREECLKRGFELNAVYECNGAMSALMLTCSGLAACYIPVEVFRLLRCEQVNLKQVAGLETCTAPILLWNNTSYISRSLRLFLEHFKQHLTEK